MNQELIKKIEAYIPYNDAEKQDKEVILQYVQKENDVLTRNNPIAHFTVSGWITNSTHDKILMIYHNIYDSWAWVGGHADGDSDFFHVICKEVEEETGLTHVKLLSKEWFGLHIITVDHHIKRGVDVSSHLHFDVEFLLEASEEDFLRIKEDENSGVQWVPIDEVCSISKEEKMKPIYSSLNQKLREFF